jgi:hypothetical protein
MEVTRASDVPVVPTGASFDGVTVPSGKQQGVVTVQHSTLVQLWAVLGVATYLSWGLRKVHPIVRDGLGSMNTRSHWVFFLATLSFFAYYEGYKGFQKGLCPRVVSRAWIVSQRSVSGLPTWHKVIAPAFCIGYFHATKKRMITSWAITGTIFVVVIFVRRLPDPWRAMIDAGVMLGLTWGVLSTVGIYAMSLIDGAPPDFDPSLPDDTPYRYRPATNECCPTSGLR